MAAHLASEGWVSTIIRQGTPGELEFQIDPNHPLFAGEGPLRLAPVFLGFESSTLFRSPRTPTEGCADLDLAQGQAGTERRFDPSAWHALALPDSPE